MGIKSIIKKAGGKAADTVAKLAVLSPEQLRDMQERREEYLTQVPSMDDAAAEELTRRLLAASSIEIYNEYLQHIHDMYIPVKREIEYDGSFNTSHNIRFFNITKWVTDKNDDQITELAKLPCGVAAIYQNEWIQPVLCKVDEFKTNGQMYEYSPENDVFREQETQEISQSLLECIMNNEIFRKDNKADIQKLRHVIIKSKLDSTIKTDFMEYIESNKENAISSLRKMMYDFLSAEKAIDSSNVERRIGSGADDTLIAAG